MGRILIKNGRVWDGDRFFYADILTQDQKILEITENITESANYTFDATGMTVAPGLIDAHMHMLGFSGPEYAICAEAACFPFGVTAAIEAGSRHGNQDTLSNLAIKALVFSDSKVENNHLNTEITEQRLMQYGNKAIGIKLFFDESSPNVSDVTPLLETCAFARSHGLKILVHCNHSPVPMEQIVAQMDPGDILTHIYHGGKHSCQDNDYAAFKLAKEKGIILDAGFAGHIHTDLRVFREAVAAGYLPDSISTDITCSSAYKRGGRYGLTMCMSMAREAGMQEDDIFRCITTAPAAAHGMDGQWGRLQVGGCADIAVLAYTKEGFSLTDRWENTLQSDMGYRCKMTVANGEIVWRD